MSVLAKEAARRNYHTLDGMRGLAAIAVVILHCPWLFADKAMLHAYFAVDIFFVLSGFVLSHAYHGRLDQGMSPFAFMKLRLIRLYPLYAGGVLLAGAWISYNLLRGSEVRLLEFQPWTWGQLRTSLAHNLLFLPGPKLGAGPEVLYALNVPAWSLLFEIVANLAFVLVWRGLTTKRLVALTAVFAAGLAWLGLRHGFINAGAYYENLDLALARVLFGFFAGVLIHRVSGHVPAWLKAPPLLLLAVMVAVLQWAPPAPALAWYDLGCVLLLAPLLALLGSRSEPSRWTLPLYSFGGLTSYAIYAVHYPASYIATFYFGRFGWDPLANRPLSGAVFLAGLLVFCWLLDRFYDAPVRAWLVHSPLRRTKTAAEEPAAETESLAA